jgi:hypothetical protein
MDEKLAKSMSLLSLPFMIEISKKTRNITNNELTNSTNTRRNFTGPVLMRNQSKFFEKEHHPMLKKDYVYDFNLEKYPLKKDMLIDKFPKKSNKVTLPRLLKEDPGFRKLNNFSLLFSDNINHLDNINNDNCSKINYPEKFRLRFESQPKLINIKSTKPIILKSELRKNKNRSTERIVENEKSLYSLDKKYRNLDEKFSYKIYI